MNIKKEDVVLFFRQNVKSIILAFVCSLVLIIGGLFYFNQNKTEDYSGVFLILVMRLIIRMKKLKKDMMKRFLLM